MGRTESNLRGPGATSFGRPALRFLTGRHIYRPEVSVQFVDGAVGWFLNDPNTWRDLHHRYDPIKRPIPKHPPGNGDEWRKIFESIYAEFRRSLIRVEGNLDDARWTSYGLSYEALRRCAELGKHEVLIYVYLACRNAHLRFLRPFKESGVRSFEDGIEPEDRGSDWGETDLRIDFEEALGKLTPVDEMISRLRIIEGRDFAEIAKMLPVKLDRSTVKRRFERCLPAIRAALRDYEPRRPGCMVAFPVSA
jgi:hypothetical protein